MTYRQLMAVDTLTSFHFLSRADLARFEMVNRAWNTRITSNASKLPIYHFAMLSLGPYSNPKKKVLIKGEGSNEGVEQFRSMCPGGTTCKWAPLVDYYIGSTKRTQKFLFALVLPNKNTPAYMVGAGCRMTTDGRSQEKSLHDFFHFIGDATLSDLVYFSKVYISPFFPMDLLHHTSLSRAGIRCGTTKLHIFSPSPHEEYIYNQVGSDSFLHYLLSQPLDKWNKAGSGGFYSKNAYVIFHIEECGQDRYLVELLLRGGHFCQGRLIAGWADDAYSYVRESLKEEQWLDAVRNVHSLALADMSKEIDVRMHYGCEIPPDVREQTNGPDYVQIQGTHSKMMLRLFENSFQACTSGQFEKEGEGVNDSEKEEMDEDEAIYGKYDED